MRNPVAALPAFALALWTGAAGPVPPHSSAGPAAAEDILARSAAVYAGLSAYADSGTGVFDTGGPKEVGHFRTSFRKPSDFYFEWGRRVSIPQNPRDSLAMPGKQLVFWMRHGDLETYSKEGALYKTYPAGTSNQPAALAAAKYGTMETIALIPSLLFPKANLVGPIQEIAELSLAGTEDVDGHHCHKLMGIARSVYPSGAITNVRPIALWIDRETLLIRKVFTDTPKGYGMGAVSRLTYTYYPTLNPTLDDTRFQFTVPETQP